MAHLPNVHKNLTDLLASDDHPQYQTDADGDARYPRKDGSGASGTYPINVSGSAASTPYAGSSGSAGGTRHMNGRKFYWNGSVGIKSYIWGASNNGDGRVIWEGHYSRSDHNHSGNYRWLFGYNHLDVGSLAGSTAYGPWAVGHGLQGNTPVAAMATCIYDDGGHSVVASIGNLWDSVNILLTARNYNVSAGETCWVSHISWV